jgi:ABC-type Fe3+ transport system permease subunit
MTLAQGVLTTGIVAAAALAVAHLLRPIVAKQQRWTWALLLAPYLAPSLLVGYAYSNFSLSLVHHPALNALWYATLLVLRLAPVAALALAFAPHPLSDEAMHCRRLTCGGANWRFRWQSGCARAPLTAFALVFILAFGEFEMASLMNVKTWPVRVFDGHAGGLPFSASLALAAGPFVVELVALGGVLALLGRQRWDQTSGLFRSASIRPAAWLFLAGANVAVCIVPVAVVLRGTAQSWSLLVENFGLGREMVTSLLFGVTAALAAYAIAPRHWWRASALCVPGLLGPLVLALVVGTAMQTAWLSRWRDTPAPLAVTLTLLLLPLAVLLRHLLRRTAPLAAVHAARLLDNPAGRQLLWILSTRRHVWVMFLLMCWGYLDLTAAAILAPIGTIPVGVRLYNLMHYGQTAVLSGMLAATFAAPWLLMGAVVATRRLWVRL